MKVFGFTGGVGMGKSTAAKLLAECGIAVVDTDTIARQIVEPGSPALGEITAEFGRGFIDQDGRLLRAKLAEQIFSDEIARQKLETILHPRIREIWLRQLDVWLGQGKAVAVVVIPLLFETNASPQFDATVCVACTSLTQESRLKSRGWSLDQIQKRRKAQWAIEKKMTLSDYVIWTEGSLDVHSEQLKRII